MSISQFRVKAKWLMSYAIKYYVNGCRLPTLDDMEILHKSDHFVVINKQCDMAINSDSPESHPVTVADQLNHKFPHLSDPTVKFGFRFCHRLDYSTSGVLCIALTKNAAKHSFIAMNSKKAEKYYLALVYGHVLDDCLTIDKSIGTDTRQDYSHCMCTSDKEYCYQPRWAVSKLLVLQRGFYDSKPATKILLKLVTGRRHQLRVHCHELGHTIIGDYTYSGRKDVVPYRMFLHAFRLHLPAEIEQLDICSEDPFTESEPRNKWQPIETVNNLNRDVFSLLS
ncbi:RNA pseudouridylate synthase domain-containing protein 1-like [Uloborus diversus]|uniref:RNA pseudouridylate synthase domain-containing protein 1-like n=1 Tax=Uloborus diversus TaxID=327109 RepID=UPI0024099E4F|nr:RNA pseudouridylate synthase domain-containing protein 1-like [Uloborus diversus]XP_054718575.1 RNA pseudouridylate synthase domain-containing protein 1-like [Uloborus diversus]